MIFGGDAFLLFELDQNFRDLYQDRVTVHFFQVLEYIFVHILYIGIFVHKKLV